MVSAFFYLNWNMMAGSVYIVGENWQLACTAGQSPQHVLSPMDILLDIRVCIFDKDPRMAK